MNNRLPYFSLPEGQVHIAFSGGRTSAYLLHSILEANGDLPERVKVVFANTGREDPRTLDFVAEVGQRWSVDIVWVQYLPESPFFEVVEHRTAARQGEPFEAMIKHKRFIPNGRKRTCTEQLKVRAARRMLVALGWRRWTKALGIRADEPQRHDQKNQPRERIWMPLVPARVAKTEVMEFWRTQPFDLPEGTEGNCRLCFQFGLPKLADQMRQTPNDIWPERMEALGFGTFFRGMPWADVRALLVDAESTKGLDKPIRRRKACGSSSDEECFA